MGQQRDFVKVAGWLSAAEGLLRWWSSLWGFSYPLWGL